MTSRRRRVYEPMDRWQWFFASLFVAVVVAAIIVPSMACDSPTPPATKPAPSASAQPKPSAYEQACGQLRRLRCAEAFLCDAKDCAEHVRVWRSDGNVRMPTGWCEDKMRGLLDRADTLDCVARSSTPEDVEDCGVGCSYDCVAPPCASKALPRKE